MMEKSTIALTVTEEAGMPAPSDNSRPADEEIAILDEMAVVSWLPWQFDGAAPDDCIECE